MIVKSNISVFNKRTYFVHKLVLRPYSADTIWFHAIRHERGRKHFSSLRYSMYCMSAAHIAVYVYLVRLSLSSPWLLDFICGSRCCNSTLPPPATCARALRENTGFCVGVRRPHSRGAKVHYVPMTGGMLLYMRAWIWSGCWWNSCTTLLWRCGGGISFLTKASEKDRDFKFNLRHISFVSAMYAWVFTDLGLSLLGSGRLGVKMPCGCLCGEVINLNPGA